VSKPPSIDISAEIHAPAGRVLRAFFDPQALNAWWGVAHAVTSPRTLGPYAIEWEPTDFRDELLGRLGGVFRGTVMQIDPSEGFFVADAYWLPPDGDPIGPMALHVAVRANGDSTHVHVVQSGYEEGARWRRYYEVVGPGYERALGMMKRLLER
jgi:uncharacterized protein YndB with AHSA1/START domain